MGHSIVCASRRRGTIEGAERSKGGVEREEAPSRPRGRRIPFGMSGAGRATRKSGGHVVKWSTRKRAVHPTRTTLAPHPSLIWPRGPQGGCGVVAVPVSGAAAAPPVPSLRDENFAVARSEKERRGEDDLVIGEISLGCVVVHTRAGAACARAA